MSESYFHSMRGTDLKLPILYFMLILVWGTTWSVIKISVGDTPFFMAAIRFFIASATLMVIQLVRKRALMPQSGHLKIILALGVGNFFIGFGFTYWGMQFVNSNITSIMWATLPLIISIYAHFMMESEKINSSKVFSLVGALIGSYFIFDVHGENFDAQSAVGMLVIMFSIIVAGYSNVLYKREGSHLDPLSVNLVGMFIGGFLLLLTAFILEPMESVELNLLTVSATIYLAVIGSALNFSVYFWLLKHISVVKMSYTTFLIPIFASFWGWLLLNESFTPGTITGGVIILLSVSLPELPVFKKMRSGSNQVGQG